MLRNRPHPSLLTTHNFLLWWIKRIISAECIYSNLCATPFSLCANSKKTVLPRSYCYYLPTQGASNLLSVQYSNPIKVFLYCFSTIVSVPIVVVSLASGKISLILRTVEGLKGSLRLGVIEADIDSTLDVRKAATRSIPAIQLRKGGFCHLDAAAISRFWWTGIRLGFKKVFCRTYSLRDGVWQ